MAEILRSTTALAVNPLKVSQTVGASLAFLGLARSLPLMHGSQGCTAFGKVFFVRHFREPIPLQTTAMDHGGQHHGGRRERGGGLAHPLRQEPAGDHRPRHHRPLRNPGHRHPLGP